jgi:putative aldouronate transport system substrate-binding protein
MKNKWKEKENAMKKKVVSMMLVCAMALGLAACGSGGDTDSGSSAAGKSQEDSGDVFNLKMQIVTFGAEMTGLSDVEDAINAITVPEIGVSVTLDPIAAWDLPSTSSLAITSNEEIDLMAIVPMSSNMDSISNYSSKNMLTPLNDLYAEYGQDIAASIGELENIGYVGENLYAIPANYYAGHGSAFVALTSELDALGYSFDEDQIYTLEDVEEVMAAYKQAKGDGYYAIAGYADNDITSTIVQTDDLGDAAVGSLMNGGIDNTTVVNRFATDEYREVYEKTREWYLDGYINPDVISITDTWTSLLQTGQYLGAFIGNNGSGLDGIIVNEQSIGQDLTLIRFGEEYATTTIASYGLWAIPVTCTNPEKTMQFLNMMYQDREASENISYILSAGLEGVTYKVVETLDDGRMIIDYADGVDRNSAPYAGQLPIYGDELKTPKYTPVDAEMFDEITNYNNTLTYSKAFGYTFDSTDYTNQISAINNVLQTYQAQLCYGTVDVDTVLPQFLSDLEAAGINDVIAANQEQLDAWLAQQ